MNTLLNLIRFIFGFFAFILLLAAADIFPPQDIPKFVLLLSLIALCIVIVLICNRQLKKLQMKEVALQPKNYSLLVIIPDELLGIRSEELEEQVIEPLFDCGNLGTCELIYLSEAITWDIDLSNHPLPLYIVVYEEFPDQDAQELIKKKLITTSDPAQVKTFLEADEINKGANSEQKTALV